MTTKTKEMAGWLCWPGLVGWLLLSFAAAWYGSRFSPGSWYASLVKPGFTLPTWVFAPVWLVLYVLMGIAAWLVWRSRGFTGAQGCLCLFVAQLALNAAWPWLFFGLHRPGLAFLEILVLWVAIFATLMVFWRRRPLAGVLLLPYLLWVGFAALLNLLIWRLNA
jgi:benzodiazapine receptor